MKIGPSDIIGLIPLLTAGIVTLLASLAFFWLLAWLLVAAVQWRRDRRHPAMRRKKFPKRLALPPFGQIRRGPFVLALVFFGLGSLVGAWIVVTDDRDENPILGVVQDIKITDHLQHDYMQLEVFFTNSSQSVAATNLKASLAHVSPEQTRGDG